MPRDKFIISEAGTLLPIYEPNGARLNGKGKHGPSVTIRPATSFTPERIRWLWDGWFARGKFHLLAGAGGTGKTTIALSIAATVSAGVRWPDGTANEPGDVLIWNGEDSITDTLLPRLMAAGANRERVHFVTGARDPEGKARSFDPANDMAELVEEARHLPDLKLIVLDSVVSTITGDSHKNTEVRRGLQPVVDLAEQLGCCLLGITHLSKNTAGREPLERVTGSLAFGAVARGVLVTVKPADKDEPRRLIRAKSNIGPDSGGFAYHMFAAPVPGHDFSAQRIDWGDALEGSARELMAVEQMDMAGEAIDEAKTFLADILRDGPVATRTIKEAAIANGHAWRTVNSAKKVMGIKATKGGFDAGWSWQMPAPEPRSKDAGQKDEGCQLV